MVLTPDETHPDVCERHIFPAAREGARVGFAAAFTVHYGVVRVPDGLRPVLIAPKGPGGELRRRFEVGEGIPALVASLEGDTKGLEIAEAYAGALGCGRAGIVRTTFREEAIADLFGEQCVLVGGLVELMKASFNTLVDRGYTPEVAYIECIAEVEYIASLISRVGLSDLDRRISSTASYGGRTRGPRVVGEGLRERLEHILDEIEDGRFYKEFKRFAAQKESKSSHTRGLDLIERARASFRDGDEHEK
jgi:ketol-acid reductoisomerase